MDSFVKEYLCGRLDVPRRSRSRTPGNLLVFHMPKTHTEEKLRSGLFQKTYSGGSLKYHVKSKSLVLLDGCRDHLWSMQQLWEDFQIDPTPKWLQVQSDPDFYDECVLQSGKHQGKTFKKCYGARKISKYAEWLMRGEVEGDSARGKTSLGMRMFLEYCRARAARVNDNEPRTLKRPASADGISELRADERRRRCD